MYVIVYGTIFKDIEGVMGPFETKDKAEEFIANCYGSKFYYIFKVETLEEPKV